MSDRNGSAKRSLRVSCLMSFYGGDDPAHAEAALISIVEQSRPPDELVIVEDGPITSELSAILDKHARRLPAKRIRFDANMGLGHALAEGVLACTHELVARMDADDLSRPRRLELQAEEMETNPSLLVYGGAIEEFSIAPGDLGRVRAIANDDGSIRRASRFRNPFNHMTVMFRRSAALAAGNYRPMRRFEDYDLWLRVARLNGTLGNASDVLVDVRSGTAMVERRRGLTYVRDEWQFLQACLAEGALSRIDVARAIAVRLPLRLLPTSILRVAYRGVLRRIVPTRTH